ncbi:MAG: hypothetical protein J6Z49_05480 [Kiritimatiellae bacterium]|nr:hypothetical protein [Kiritimatiellia bacterium]
MNERIDMSSFVRGLNRFRESCPFKEGRDIADDIESFGRALDGLDALFADFDAEVFRLMSQIESDSGVDGNQVPDSTPDRIPDKDEPPMSDERDSFHDTQPPVDDSDKVPEDSTSSETPDEIDQAQTVLNAPLKGAMGEFTAALSELDDILDVEVKTKELLTQVTRLLDKLKKLQNLPRVNLPENTSQMDRIGGEILKCQGVYESAKCVAEKWEKIAELKFTEDPNKIVASAEVFMERYFWSGVAERVKKRVKYCETELQNCINDAKSRKEKALELVNRAKTAISTKKGQLKVLKEKSVKDMELQEEIDKLGKEIQYMLESLHKKLVEKFGQNFPQVFTGGKTESHWNFSLCKEEVVTHAILTRRMDASRRCQTLRRGIEKSQPPLDELSTDNINGSHVFPLAISMGTMLYTHSRPGVEVDVPELVEFPGDKPILVPNPDWIAPILLRLAWTMPQGALEIIALDQSKSGMNVQPVNDLSDVPGLLRVVTGTDGLQDALEGLDKYMGKIGTERFKHGISDWASYNARHIRHPLPCKVLAVCSLSGFDSWSSLAATLRKVIDNGKRHGVLTIVCDDALNATDDRTRSFLKGLVWHRLGEPCPDIELKRLKHESFTPEMPENAGELMCELAKVAKKRAERPAKSFLNLFERVPMWKTSSADGLSAVIGWDAADRPVSFKLDTGGEGGTAVHALVGGQTGSGKSVLLHTLIQSLAYVYSPEELQFYLFDFKNGVEFNKYSDETGALWMPHIKVVSVQNDPRYALELFRHLVEVEFPARNEKFKRSGCTKIGDYVKKGGKMPRLIVIVDEFQELFGDHDGEDVGEDITAGLKAIVKQGRSVGVHLVIATQTMASAHATMKGSANDILQQIGLRLALWGTGDEGILADNNKAAASIVPRQQCILNARAGLNGGNVVFNFPFASPDAPDGPAYRMKMVETAKSYGFPCDGKMFNGSSLPSPPPLAELKKTLAVACEESFFALCPGVKPDFAATPLCMPFDNLAGEHLLVGGEDVGKLSGDLLPANVWSGLRASVFRCLSNTLSCAVLYYNPGSVSLPANLPQQFLRATMKTSETELLELFRRFLSTSAARKVVFVENFHKAGLLHPGDKQQPVFSFGDSSAQQTPQETARSIFLSAFTGAGTIPFSTILFTKNVKNTCERVLGRFGSEANILEACFKRIAFNVTGDILKAMIPDSTYLQQRGPRRVWFNDRKTGLVEAFVPYAEK